MDQKKQDIQRQLQALSDSYIAQLPARVADIERGWADLPQAETPSSTLFELFRQVHGLAGSAGTFGVPELGREARKVELCLKAKLDKAQDWSHEEQAEITAGIAKLKRLVAQTHADAPAQSLPFSAEEKTQPAEQPRRLVYLMEEEGGCTSGLQSKLANFGYQVKTFHDRAELIAAIQRQQPIALIMDFHASEVQAACTNWLIEFQRDRSSVLPVIFIAKDTRFEVRLQSVRAGGYAYLEQPVDIAALVDRLDAVDASRQSEPYRVVVVDDDRQLAQHYSLALAQAGIEARVVDDPAHLLDLLSEFHPDLILMDLYMPQCTGQELAQLIRQEPSHVSMPIVFLSAETDPEKQYSALMTGGDDFITKPIQDNRLIAVVRSRAQRARVLDDAMSRDSLTGLLKHTRIKEALEVELMRAHRHDGPLSYAMIDIDFFKRVNDTHGHPMGDRVIKSLSSLLMQRLRQTDLIGRYGGEEFAAILPDTDAEGAAAVMEQVRTAFSELEFESDSGSFSVTLSVGLVTCRECSDAGKVAEAADQALYEAKRSGRNRVVRATL